MKLKTVLAAALAASTLVATLLASSTDQESHPRAHLLVTTADGQKAEGVTFNSDEDGGPVVTVEQSDKAFYPNELQIKRGTRIAFVNSDTIAHNIYCKKDDFEFNTGSQEPGQVDTFTFDRDGKFLVRCAVHPQMKLFVTVE